MANKLTAGDTVRAMGTGTHLLELLVKKIRDANGDPEILQFLTRPRFKKNLDHIIKTAVDCDWRVPLSDMQKLAEKSYRKEFEVDEEQVEAFRNIFWTLVLLDLGIPFRSYSDDPNNGPPAIPDLLRKDLEVKMAYPLLISKGRYVVVMMNSKNDVETRPGEMIIPKLVTEVAIAETRYFDFSR